MVNKKKRSNQHSNRLLLCLGLLLIAALVSSLLVYRHHSSAVKAADQASQGTNRPSNSVSYSAAPAADNNANEARKGSATAAPTLDSGTPTSTTFTVQLLNATVTSDNKLHIGNSVSGTTSGTCTLTASKSGQSTLQLASSSVVQDVNTYDCGVFNTVLASAFPSSGVWKVTLTVSSNGSQAADSANLTIN